MAFYLYDGLMICMNERSGEIKVLPDDGSTQVLRVTEEDSRVVVVLKGGPLPEEIITVSRDAGFKISHRVGPQEA